MKLLLHAAHKHLRVSEVLVVSQCRQDFRGGQVVEPEGLMSREEVHQVPESRFARLSQLLVGGVVEQEGKEGVL